MISGYDKKRLMTITTNAHNNLWTFMWIHKRKV